MQSKMPWERFSISVGGFFNALDSSVRLGTKNVGIEVDVEDALGFDVETSVFRLDSFWRFTKSRRQRLDLNWFAIRRNGTKTLLEDFEIGDTVFPVNNVVESSFDIDFSGNVKFVYFGALLYVKAFF